MKKIWTTQTGEEIPYSKLTNRHLVNIISFLEKKAKKGAMISHREFSDLSYNGDSYMPDYYRISYQIFGKDVLDLYDYKGLKKELSKRKICDKNYIK